MRILPIEVQKLNEVTYYKQHVDKYIKDMLKHDVYMVTKIEEGVSYLEAWMKQEFHPTKKERIEQLNDIKLFDLVLDVYTQVLYCDYPVLFTAFTGMMAGILRMDDKRDGIQTIAEIVAVLCNTDVFDINKYSKQGSLYIQSRVQLHEKLKQMIENTRVLPPMVCPPRLLRHNWQTGHVVTNTGGVILGKGNKHSEDVCLDFINLMNTTNLELNTDFLCKVEEEPKEVPDTVEKQQQWDDFKKKSYHYYMLLAKQSVNGIWFNWKVDTRGRLYSEGYYINPQGTAFKKAMLDFKEKQTVEVPDEFKN